jgi:choline kinase
LIDAGISKIIIVTGHESNYIKDQIGQELSDRIQFIENVKYSKFGNLVSLILGLKQIEGPCLFLDADIIYEARVIREILSKEIGNIFVTSTPCGSGDEVFVISGGDEVVEISKAPSIVSNRKSEYVGITAITRELGLFIGGLSELKAGNLDYESFINKEVLKKFKFRECFFEDLAWSEVDNIRDWERIQNWDDRTRLKVLDIH